VTAVAVNVIVTAVTILMVGFVGVWLILPRTRGWIEAPKYQPLRWDAVESHQPRSPGSGAGRGDPPAATSA
jgi:hypothetical protein